MEDVVSYRHIAAQMFFNNPLQHSFIHLVIPNPVRIHDYNWAAHADFQARSHRDYNPLRIVNIPQIAQ